MTEIKIDKVCRCQFFVNGQTTSRSLHAAAGRFGKKHGMKFSCRKEGTGVAGGRNETKKRRLLKLIKQQLFALSATRSIGFCIKLPVPVVTMSGAAFRVALCHRGQRILGLLPTSASLAICREHHHVDGRQQAEDVQLGSHSPPLIFGG